MALCVYLLAAAATPPKNPHPHKGILDKYERRPPSYYGMRVDKGIEARLLDGKAYVSKVDLPNGFRRTMAMKDVDAPPDIVFGQIIDVEGYPKKIDGVIGTRIYRDYRTLSGIRVFCAHYTVRFATVIAESYVQHEIDPFSRCMTFQLDYSIKSDVADQVGYWYVEPLRNNRARVYYSVMSTVPFWVPKMMHGAVLDLVAKRSTSWVDVESRKEYAAQSSRWTAAFGAKMRKLKSRF